VRRDDDARGKRRVRAENLVGLVSLVAGQAAERDLESRRVVRAPGKGTGVAVRSLARAGWRYGVGLSTVSQ
jgi:hypothetical protein